MTRTTAPRTYESEIASVLTNPEFLKLKSIGGHKVYHLEGDALTHTMMVAQNGARMFGENSLMHLVCLLHDIGKIYTSVCNGPDDWSYPNHARGGAENLARFLPEDHPDFFKIRWYIANHIKPLFWRDNDAARKCFALCVPDGCSVENLAKLAICDVEGSVSVEPQTELIAFLRQIAF